MVQEKKWWIYKKRTKREGERREENEKSKSGKMLTTGDVGWRVYRSSLYYSCNFVFNLKLFQNKVTKKIPMKWLQLQEFYILAKRQEKVHGKMKISHLNGPDGGWHFLLIKEKHWRQSCYLKHKKIQQQPNNHKGKVIIQWKM